MGTLVTIFCVMGFVFGVYLLFFVLMPALFLSIY